jgi:hypothetical protein
MNSFKFFSNNDNLKRLRIKSMDNICGVQYRRLITNEYGDLVQRVHLGGVFPFEGTSYSFTWLPISYVGNGYYTNDTFNTYTQVYNGSLPNFLMEHSDKKILIYSIEFGEYGFYSENSDIMYHFTNEEPYRNLTISAILL